VKAKRIIIAGGGTGGHIFPAIAIANAIKKLEPSTEILFVGAKGKMEMEKVPQAGYRIEGLDIAGFNRSSLIKNIGLPFKLLKSFFQVREILRRFSPDAVVGVGGYSSFPVLRYAQQQGIPTYIHESNSFAGRSNILLGEKATAVFVATDGMEKFFPEGKILVTGNPVRAVISESKVSRADALNFFGLPDKPTILSIGGSLGAKSINESMASGLERIEGEGLQLIWQTGKPYSEQGRAAAKGMSGVWVSDFIKEMEYAFAVADVVISRAGAMAIAELCVVGKPAIFVPYPFAAEDHQTVNAMNLEMKQAGIVVRDEEAGRRLVDEAVGLIKNHNRRNELSRNIAALGIKNADMVIAAKILGKQ
jgi:UDP-N-acetylglucosamine--N-acetylmuramyl-(pentapeptide) pyrophosphoryl-undecaprenol N-acetylglucosamine transferase